ncbi:MAG TPA: dihydrodipicolinate synthase family protein [Chitinophagaceae bacterium]|nr:dihydrodipicolinate synthase family protein [Chitinophagaceae bacterium]
MTGIKWEGIYSALLTPFDTNDCIDFKLFEINIDSQVEAGIDGIVLGGSLGEASTLTFEEKKSLLAHAKRIVKDKIPVVLNIAEQSTQEAIRVARNAESNGADGLMVLPPMRYNADKNETLEYFRRIASNTSLPIMIYNNPYDYKIEITLDMFGELEEIPTIQAIKESTRDVSNVTRLKNRFKDRFKILCGVDTLAFEELILGADGWVAGLVDAFPAETVAVYRLIKAGKFHEALEICRWFMPLLELDIHAKFAQYIKLAATQTGLGSEYVRAPRLRLAGEERERILQTITDAINTRHEILSYLESASLVIAGTV